MTPEIVNNHIIISSSLNSNENTLVSFGCLFGVEVGRVCNVDKQLIENYFVVLKLKQPFCTLNQASNLDILKKTQGEKNLKTQEKYSITQGKKSRSRQIFTE